MATDVDSGRCIIAGCPNWCEETRCPDHLDLTFIEEHVKVIPVGRPPQMCVSCLEPTTKGRWCSTSCMRADGEIYED